MIKRLGTEPCIHENCQLHNVELGEYTEVGMYNVFENIKLDDFSYTGQFCTLQNVEIGKFSNIASFCIIVGLLLRKVMKININLAQALLLIT